MTRFNLAISAGATVLTLATTAFAGPQYIDRTGYAASGYDVVAYFDLDQTPVGMDQPAAIPGRADITTGPPSPSRPKPTATGSLQTLRPLPRNTTGTAPMVWRRAARCRQTRTCGGSWTASYI